jgi:hypothetical protein|tara:strand:- start:91 stop:285 length:195 start_codon:yes stop_codon:yes gene_type:complete
MNKAKKIKKPSRAKKKLEYDHKWYDSKTSEMTEERKTNRSWESKEVLQRIKKIKLAIKDKLARM